MGNEIRCLIVDDEPLAIDVIKVFIEQIPQLTLIGTCEDAMSTFGILNREKVDLLFLDIEMPKLNGIEFIKSLDTAPHVILTTAYRKYAIDSYEIDIVDYLLKPISFSRFFKAINKYLRMTNDSSIVTHIEDVARRPGSMYVYSDKKNVKVYFDDVLYIESLKDYIRIHTLNKTIISKDTISRYETMLPEDFMRVHRSYIVNSTKITAFTHHDIEIGIKEIPIGSSYKRQVLIKLKGED